MTLRSPPRHPEPVIATNRVAVVTGGGGGIGQAIAERLARDGLRVAILDVDGDAARRTAEAITRSGGTARGYGADVSDRGQVDAAMEAARSDLGPLGVVVANAAIAPRQSFLDLTEEEWERTLAVNLTGTFHTVQSALPDLVSAGWGRVVLISSSSAQRGAAKMCHYSASKGGQLALAKSLAVEFAKKGITANAIAPSSVDTPSVRKKRAAGVLPEAEKMAKFIPVGRMGAGEDIAAAVSYLVSEEASYVTGQTLSVNGGSFIG